MPLSLAQTQHINRLADVLYEFLPGTPHPYADPAVSFRGVARDLKVSRDWKSGSKLGSITFLLSSVFQRDRARFATLLREVVQRGLAYREAKNPVKRGELDEINDLVQKLGLRVKELHDPAFLNSLPGSPTRKASESQTPPESVEAVPPDLTKLRAGLKEITDLPPQPRGYAFERFLNGLFGAFGLAPKRAFRLVGEQIDGSFHHGGQTYLVEAKWQGDRCNHADLLVFSGKVGGKAHWSRGAHISLSGYSSDGLEAFGRGKPTNIICFDGLDLHYVLDGKVDLSQLILRKSRSAAESNAAFVSVRDLFPTLP